MGRSSRYTRLKNDDEATDDDSVALMLGQAPPRLTRFGATEYVQLEDLDEEGNTTEDPRGKRTHEVFMENRRKSRKLLIHILAVAFTIVTVAMLVTGYRRRQEEEEEPAYVPVLAEPLNPYTKLSNGTHSFKRSTLVISLDGMHPHYLSESRTPRLNELVKSGFATPYIRPSFPTQTFPNHWTLITGNYPINHGIVGNTFYDPELDLEFVNTDPSKSRDRRFWGGEPLWITASQHGVKSAVHMWPGSEADWGSQYPDEYSQFDRDEPLDSKLAKIVEWLDRGEEMPQLMLAYVPNIDTVGHQNGIVGPSVMSECLSVDDFMGKVMDALKARNLVDVVNLVVVSDHGMAPTNNDHIVFLDDIVSNYANATSDRGWPLAGLRFKSQEEVDEAIESAKDARGKDGNKGYQVYASDQTPARWRFTTGELSDRHGHKTGDQGKYAQRLAPMYIVPDPTYSLVTHEKWDEMGHNYFLKGVHGYDNESPLMRAIFLAQGPAFPPGRYYSFDNVDVYSAICRSLGFKEASTSDGNFSVMPLDQKLSSESYPGTPSVTEFFEDTSFRDFYQS